MLASCGTSRIATTDIQTVNTGSRVPAVGNIIAMSTKDIESEDMQVGKEIERESDDTTVPEERKDITTGEGKPDFTPFKEQSSSKEEMAEVTTGTSTEEEKSIEASDKRGEANEKSDVQDDSRVAVLYLENLTLEQKIGQRFIANIPGKELSDDEVRLIQDEYVGGFILYPWNVDDPDQVRVLTSDIQKMALENDPPVRLFICVDQEGGRVNAFRFSEVTKFPSPYYWGQYDDPTFIEAASYVINREILELGCNMNFAPVLDIYGKPDKTVIGDRSMGRDPEKVGTFGLSYLKGAEKAGVISVVKHFPGHGSTTTDSHLDLPVVDLGEEDLYEKDFKPFRMAIENGADAVMTSHVLYSTIDPEYPATLSVRIMRGILRNQLGFQGVIISDGISMGALSENFDITETLLRSFKAGIDLILVHNKYDLRDLINRVMKLYELGLISEDEINEGVKRVLNLKIKYGLIPPQLTVASDSENRMALHRE
jgi:beta-N-acetylhexosaminidase